jgi:hypothetical protein
MLAARRTAIVAAMAAAAWVVGTAATSEAANQQYVGSLVIESFGNDNVGGTGASQFFSVFGMPQGVQCNPNQPLCPDASTPVTLTMMGAKVFNPRGGSCVPIGYFGVGTRPANGATATTGLAANVHYRNPAFFTPGGAPNATLCSATTTVGGMGATMFLTTNSTKRGVVMKGNPLTGEQIVTLSGAGPAGFFLKAAPATPVKTPGPTGFGLRRTTFGEFNAIFPYVYSYTYATLRNDAGSFFAGGGAGAFNIKYYQGANTIAQIVQKAGANQFGGVMRLLGQLTTKVCYYRNGGCSLGGNNWRYDAIGTSAFISSGGMVTMGYSAMYTAMYYHTNLMQASTVNVHGYRFPWTVGTVTVSGLDPPHKTIERRKGYDNRTSQGMGTIQLVTPLLTRWQQPAADQFTGGIAVLRLQFVPEPGKWALLASGLGLLGVFYRVRRR